jgi:hypothetical protein
MAVEIDKTSRLNFYNLVSADGYEFWMFNTLPVPSGTKNDVKIVINDNNRIDNLAYEYYEDPVLWWIIAISNAMKLTTDLKVGDEFRIPAKDNIFKEIFK